MSYGPKQTWTTTIPSAASTSSYIDMGDKSYRRLGVYYGTMSTGAALTVYGGVTSTSLYPVQERAATATIQYQAMTVATSVSGAWAYFDCPPLRYVQFVASATVTNGVTITVAADD